MPSMNPAYVGSRLRTARAQAGITQLELSMRSGVSERTIRRLEHAAGPETQLGTLKRLVIALDVPFDYLIGA